MQAEHAFIGGASGGGKSTLMRERFAQHDAGPSVWVDHTGNDHAPGVTCRSLADMLRAVRSCDTVADVRDLSIYLRAGGIAGTEAARRFAIEVGSFFDGDLRTAVFVDECQVVLPDDETRSNREDNPLAWILHEGRDVPIEAQLSTQDPTEVFYPPIKNCATFVWAGPLKVWHEGWARYWGFDGLDFPDSVHEYVIIEPSSPPRIIDRGETDPRFG